MSNEKCRAGACPCRMRNQHSPDGRGKPLPYTDISRGKR